MENVFDNIDPFLQVLKEVITLMQVILTVTDTAMLILQHKAL